MPHHPTLQTGLRRALTVLLLAAAVAGGLTTPTVAPAHANQNPTPRSFRVGVRVYSKVTPAQIDFLNAHYDYLMTPALEQSVRDAIDGPQLILYRSIQGTWTGFNQFDWAHIDAHENMFCHHQGERILTAWNSWLMNPSDFVDPDAPDAMDHWINYYALTAAEQVYRYDYDGLFIDSASHKLSPGAVLGKMPDDYDPVRWRESRIAALAYIKSQLPDKSVVFNGLHSGAGAEESLENTDGGMWETFAFKPESGDYYGPAKWLEAVELIARHNQDKTIVLVAKKAGLTGETQTRLFLAASYLLVSSDYVIFAMSDLDYEGQNVFLYYPEYDLYLGEPLGTYTVNTQGLYMREFADGLVLVNPSATQTLTFRPTGHYRQVVPEGGGVVPSDGDWQGTLSYEDVGESVTLPPLSGVILLAS